MHNFFLVCRCWEEGGVELDLSSAKSQKKLKISHVMLEPVGAGATYDFVDEAGLGVMSGASSDHEEFVSRRWLLRRRSGT
jgi:hypothetical protein